MTGNDSNDRWLAAYPNEGGLRNNADYICLIYVCNHFGCPTVERREYNDPQKQALGIKSFFIFTPHNCGVVENRKLEAAYDEVWDCFSCKAYKATVIRARSVLENIVNRLIGEARFDKPNKSKSGRSKEKWRGKGLSKKIEKAEKSGVIPKLATKNARAIKLLGDSSTYNIAEDITTKDVKAVIRLLEDVVRATYESKSERNQVT
ncbi:DUF4145 domain-containing protein [Bifidobacterium apicola]|uniref:DUF4145 domain-containing protein n=1 Tax=Bifidobacterium apicola TaxID=3230739 RepID=UPI0036F3A612